MDDAKKSLGIYIIGGTVIVANVLLLFLSFFFPNILSDFLISRVMPLLAMIGAYPLDFFQNFYRDEWPVRLYWSLTMILSAGGLFLFNSFARSVFIILNILHIAVLSVIVATKFGNVLFLDYFFKLYFSLVASGVYVGFVTMPEVRVQFQEGARQKKWLEWFLRTRHKTISPRDAQGYYNLGLAYRRLERYTETIEALKKAIAASDQQPDYHYHLGMTLLKLKKYDEAIKSLKEAVRLEPLHLEARFHLGETYQKTGCSEEAIAAFQRCSFLKTENPLVYRHLGEACLAAGRIDEALWAMEKAVNLDGADPVAAYQLAVILIKRQGIGKDVEEYLKRAVQLKPDFADAHLELGRVCVGLGRYKDAVRSFKNVLAIERDNKQAHYHLGFAYAMLKDFDSARREYNYLKSVDEDLANNLLLVIR